MRNNAGDHPAPPAPPDRANHAAGTAAIEIHHLRVVRGGRAVIDGLDATVPAGQLVGLLGPSGSGKTTLMRVIVGVQRGVTGEARVLGLPAGARELRPRIGYVTQAPSAYADLSVGENLAYFAATLGARSESVERALADVDLVRYRDTRVGRLSGGERSRVSLAVALLGDPELLVLDEPTVGLDPLLRMQLWDVFRGVAARGTTVLVSSHVMDEAVRCDRLMLMRQGRLLADATLPELLERTGTGDAEAAFLALVQQEMAA